MSVLLLPSHRVSLYIHVPFCFKLCPYCAFYKQIWSQNAETDFVTALLIEASFYQSRYPDLVIDTVYLGGGTPNALSPSAMERLFTGLATTFNLATVRESTIELNPEASLGRKLSLFKILGINRASVGIQSFHEDELKLLGRHPKVQLIHDTIATLKAGQITNINVDLMFGFPASTVDKVRKSTESAIALSPQHLSTYSLTIEPGTPFMRSGVKRVDSDLDAAQFKQIRTTLGDAGYTHYEISAFAKSGFESQHNSRYWQFEPFIGLGPGAHSFFHFRRYRNPSSLAHYVRNPIPAAIRSGRIAPTPTRLLVKDFILTQLRTKQGLSLAQFQNTFGIDFIAFHEKSLTELAHHGLLTISEHRVAPTPEGMSVLDDVILRLI